MTPSKAILYRFIVEDEKGTPATLLQVLNLALEETRIHFSEARIKLETTYKVLPDALVAIIEGGTPCGEHLAEAMSGMLQKQYGASGYRVERMPERREKSRRDVA